MKLKSITSRGMSGAVVAGLVALAVGAAGTTAAAAQVAGASALTAAQTQQKQRELKKCNKKSTAKKRKACKKQVNQKYAKLAQPAGVTKVVNVGDNFFAPSLVDLKVNDSIKWSWANVAGYEAHNASLQTGPTGVSRSDFTSQTTAVNSYTFKRTFVKPGDYSFVCTLHFGMGMSVKVTN